MLTKLLRYTALVMALLSTSHASAGETGAGANLEEHALSVYKSPTCGCCVGWVEHMEDFGFGIEIHHPQDLLQIKTDNSIPAGAQSCHTSVSDSGFVFEGHIPAKYIHQFLENPPEDAIGLAVPAMPLGSPGMEVDDRFTPYSVFVLKKDGTTEVFIEVRTKEQQYN